MITGLGEEPEANSDGSIEVLVPLFGFVGTEGGGEDAFLGNKEKFLNSSISTHKNRQILTCLAMNSGSTKVCVDLITCV